MVAPAVTDIVCCDDGDDDDGKFGFGGDGNEA